MFLLVFSSIVMAARGVGLSCLLLLLSLNDASWTKIYTGYDNRKEFITSRKVGEIRRGICLRFENNLVSCEDVSLCPRHYNVL